jgi:hypothetical protein
MRVPSGDHAGAKSFPGPLVKARGVSGATVRMKM